MSRADKLIEARRLEILRFLVTMGGEENDRVIERIVRKRGFYTVAYADIRADVDHLDRKRCVTFRPQDELRIVTLTPLGEDCAHGRGKPVEGVEHSIWRR